MRKSVATWLRKVADRTDPEKTAATPASVPAPLIAPPTPAPKEAVSMIPTAYINEVSDAYALVAHVERLANAIGAGRRHVPNHGQ